MVKKNNGRVPLAAAAACAGLLAAGCGAAAVYVPAGDPVLRACQAADVQDIDAQRTAVDQANNTNNSPDGGVGYGIQMSPGQITALRHAAASYRTLAGQVTGHPAFTAALRNEAQEFTVAASDNGLTTNSVAIAVDKFAGEITADCGSFTVGTAPEAGKPGPGVMNWGWFWIASLGYLAMALAAGYLIAVAQRAKPRKKRLSPGQISWLAAVWWVTIFTAAGGAYRQLLATATLSPDERKDARLAALAKENAQLEAGLKKPLP
jgi:hypothetical protein